MSGMLILKFDMFILSVDYLYNVLGTKITFCFNYSTDFLQNLLKPIRNLHLMPGIHYRHFVSGTWVFETLFFKR